MGHYSFLDVSHILIQPFPQHFNELLNELMGLLISSPFCCFPGEADINMGLMREPAVPRRSDPTYEIHPSIE